MAKSLIRWNRSDYSRLSQAVSQFNKQVRKLENLENKNQYLPELKEYKEIKERIVSRNELNRVIRSLKRFSKERSQETIELGSGEKLTRWEYQELGKARSRAVANLTNEAIKIEMESKSIGMGDQRMKEINRTIASFDKLENKKGDEFQRTKRRIFIEGTSDRELYKAKIFRDNMYKALEELKSYDNYEVLKKELDKYKNPLTFYEKVKNNDILMDIFKWYRGEDGSILIYGSFESVQEAFNSMVEKMGLELEIPNIAES